MPSYHVQTTAHRVVPCTMEEFEELKNLIEPCDTGFKCEYFDDGIYIYSEEESDPFALPGDALQKLAKLLCKNSLKYVQFGIAYYADRPVVDAACGGGFRIHDNGTISEGHLVFE